jgi:hypothetical protein
MHGPMNVKCRGQVFSYGKYICYVKDCLVQEEDKFIININKICNIKTGFSRGPKSYFTNTRNKEVIELTGKLQQ